MPIEPKSFLWSADPETGVATLILNRPERLNALTFEVYGERLHTFLALPEETDVRAVVITGQGKAFCSGGDVRDIIGPFLEADFDRLHDFTRMTCDLIGAIRRCGKPVIAATSARIAFLFTKVGLSGADMGVAWLLPRLVGLGRATELLMTGSFIDDAEAHRIGLYNQVVDDGHVLDVALSLAESLARGPAGALAVTKRQLDAEADQSLEQALVDEAREQAVCMLSPDFREAYQAFVDKREPRFE